MSTEETTEEKKELTLDSLDEELANLKKFYWEQIDRLEQRVELQEGMIALLTQGFAEVASSVEAAMIVIASENDEKSKQLEEVLAKTKDKVMDVLNSSPKEEEKDNDNHH